MNFSKDTLNLINKKIHELELLKKKNHKKIIKPINANITTKEPVDIEKTFKINSQKYNCGFTNAFQYLPEDIKEIIHRRLRDEIIY